MKVVSVDSRVQCAKEKLQEKVPREFKIIGFSYEPELFGNMSALIMGYGLTIEFGVDRGLIDGCLMWSGGKKVTIENLMGELKIPMNNDLIKLGLAAYSFNEFIQCLNNNLDAIQRMGQQ